MSALRRHLSATPFPHADARSARYRHVPYRGNRDTHVRRRFARCPQFRRREVCATPASTHRRGLIKSCTHTTRMPAATAGQPNHSREAVIHVWIAWLLRIAVVGTGGSNGRANHPPPTGRTLEIQVRHSLLEHDGKVQRWKLRRRKSRFRYFCHRPASLPPITFTANRRATGTRCCE